MHPVLVSRCALRHLQSKLKLSGFIMKTISETDSVQGYRELGHQLIERRLQEIDILLCLRLS